MHIWKTSWPEGCSTNSLGHTVFYCWCYIFFGMHDLKTLGWVPNHQVILNCLLGSAWKLNEHFRSTKFNDDGGKSDFMQGEFTTPPEAYMVCSWECEPLPWARCGGSFGWTWIRGSAHSHLSTTLWQTDEQAGLRFFFKVFLFPQDVYNSCRLEFLMSGKRTQAPNISHLLWQSQVLLERPTIARDSQSHVPTSTAAHRRRRHVFPGWWATCATPWLHMFFVFARKVWEAVFSKLGNLAFGTLTWNWSQVEECGQYQSFDLKLSNSATEFKSVYAERFPNALVWDSQALSEAICFSCDFTGVLWFIFSFQIQRCCISPLELRTYPKILERKQTDNGSMRWMVLCPLSRHPVLVCAFTCVESKFFFWWRTFENNQ